MNVAIGLPNAVPGTTGEQLTEWSEKAETRGFSSLGTIDRIVYGSYEPLVALTAAAAVTERIGLTTAVLLAPLRDNGALLAKQALSLNALSGGRLTLGLGLGGREDDFAAVGADMGTRGAAIGCYPEEGRALEAERHRFVAHLFDDSLRFAGTKMIRRILGLAHVEDLESIENRQIRAECELNSLSLARRLVLDASAFRQIDQVNAAAREIYENR